MEDQSSPLNPIQLIISYLMQVLFMIKKLTDSAGHLYSQQSFYFDVIHNGTFSFLPSAQCLQVL